MIKPKPIDVKLVKFASLKSGTKLSSNSILVKTRTNVHVLPLRCPYEYRQRSSANTWLAEKYDRLSKVVDNFTDVVDNSMKRLTTDFNQTIHRITMMENQRTEEISNASELRMKESIRLTIDSSNDKIQSYFNDSERSMKTIIKKIENAILDTKNHTENLLNRRARGSYSILVVIENISFVRCIRSNLSHVASSTTMGTEWHHRCWW